MSALVWRSVGAVDPRRLGEARRQAHNAAQWLVRLAHSYMVPQPHARHTLLRWDPQRQALVTQEFLPRLTVELRIPELALQFKEDDRAVPHVIEIDDRTPAEVEAWVLVELLHRGVDRDRFSKSLPYEMPDLMTGDAVRYVAEPLAAELDELAAWFANAAAVLAAIESNRRRADAATPAPWCRPEVFDLAILLPLRPQDTSSGAMLRAGFSAGDGGSDQPYFYVASRDAKAGATPRPDTVLTAASLLAGETTRERSRWIVFARPSASCARPRRDNRKFCRYRARRERRLALPAPFVATWLSRAALLTGPARRVAETSPQLAGLVQALDDGHQRVGHRHDGLAPGPEQPDLLAHHRIDQVQRLGPRLQAGHSREVRGNDRAELGELHLEHQMQDRLRIRPSAPAGSRLARTPD